jgi:hypothetical protein
VIYGGRNFGNGCAHALRCQFQTDHDRATEQVTRI